MPVVVVPLVPDVDDVVSVVVDIAVAVAVAAGSGVMRRNATTAGGGGSGVVCVRYSGVRALCLVGCWGM